MPAWEEGFPIDREAEYYVSRRDLTKFLTLGSAALAGSNCVMAYLGMIPHDGPFPELPVARVDEVRPGQAVLFRYPTEKDPCLLFRDGEGVLRAYSQVCTHLSCAVVYRPEEATLYCPCHHGHFTLDAGRPAGGPPTRPLPRIRLEQRDGQIFAVGVEV